jgi:hypothetical protein
VYLITSELFPTVLRYNFIHTNMIFHFLTVSLSPTIYFARWLSFSQICMLGGLRRFD